MKVNGKDWMDAIIEDYENARNQAGAWWLKERNLFKLIRDSLNKRYSSMVAKKLNALCEKYFVSENRHWTLINHSISDGMDYSTTPPKINPCVYAEFLLYIHEDDAVCRDEIKTHFNISEMDSALERIGKMMESGTKKGGAK